MPARRHRTFRYRKKHVRTPSGKSSIQYKVRKAAVAKCFSCGRPLGGMPINARYLPKSSRRPNRPLSGNLCASCSRERLKQLARE
ncbi:MAG: 50S ribosomal protein L34e [Candidatus Hadarchaeota archaeon]